ncbi:hypothetical protein [Mucilaginibacter sp.]|uniref:hypothetical protein n=1 Tax=Mucilaginibacter sp. TaxID=1882438 RepID=UPI00262DB48C|nr:hypothetical protein [Mucilaginibacter sp.]
MEKAGQHQIDLKMIGGLAVYQQCGVTTCGGLERQPYKDIDFLGKSDQNIKAEYFFKKLGFRRVGLNDWGANIEFHNYRAQVDGLNRELDIEVYFGSLEFNHLIPKPYFSSTYPFTIPPGQLLLSKWAIVDLTEKDIIDIGTLLLNFDIGDQYEKSLSQSYLNSAFSDGLAGARMAKTCTINLTLLQKYFNEGKIENDSRVKLFNQFTILDKILTDASVSTIWKIRNNFGLEKKWYRDAQPRQI